MAARAAADVLIRDRFILKFSLRVPGVAFLNEAAFAWEVEEPAIWVDRCQPIPLHEFARSGREPSNEKTAIYILL
ncbi:MAG: hypothetical protein CMJ64_27085 [Planctomycetaceae bacterium]|nr:hypothetical protein [Planctomycetaceae bacterium]